MSYSEYEQALRAYLKESQKLGMWPTTEVAIKLLQDRVEQPFAIDVGCGSGRDAISLLKAGFTVLAIDNNEYALELLNEGAVEIGKRSLLIIDNRSMEDVKELPKADLVVAGVSLPYCNPSKFPLVWNEVLVSLKTRGVFAGHFFGIRDSWHGYEYATTHTQREIEALLNGLKIHQFEETEEDKVLVDGSIAHRHTYHVVAEKL